jgi:hypothetical protein
MWRQGQIHDREGRWLGGHPKDRVHSTYDVETLDRPHQDPVTTWSHDGAWGAGLRWVAGVSSPFVTDVTFEPRSDLHNLPATADVVAAHPTAGLVLVAGSDGTGLFDPATDRFTAWPDAAFPVRAAVWHPRGERVILVREDLSVQLRDPDGVVKAELPARTAPIWRATWSADGSWWALAAFQRQDGRIEAETPGPVPHYDRDGREVAQGPEGFYGWVGPRDVPLAIQDGLPVLFPSGSEPVVLDAPPHDFKLHLDPLAPWLLVTHGDGKALLWSDAGERVADLGNTQDQPTVACFDPRGELLVIGTELGTLRFVPLSDEVLVERARSLTAR